MWLKRLQITYWKCIVAPHCNFVYRWILSFKLTGTIKKTKKQQCIPVGKITWKLIESTPKKVLVELKLTEYRTRVCLKPLNVKHCTVQCNWKPSLLCISRTVIDSAQRTHHPDVARQTWQLHVTISVHRISPMTQHPCVLCCAMSEAVLFVMSLCIFLCILCIAQAVWLWCHEPLHTSWMQYSTVLSSERLVSHW